MTPDESRLDAIVRRFWTNGVTQRDIEWLIVQAQSAIVAHKS